MTLTELTEHLCQKIGQSDDESLAAAKAFLQARYRMIWDLALWKDTQVLLSCLSDQVAPGQIVVPETIERVLGIRNNGNEALAHVAPGAILAYDPALFSAAGHETNFIHLPGVVSRKILPTALQVSFTPAPSAVGLPADAYLGQKIFIRGGTQVPLQEEVTLGLIGQPSTTYHYYDEVTVISKPGTPGEVLVDFSGTGGTIVLGAAQTTAPLHARVQLLPAPAERTTYLIHGKLRCRGLAYAADTTQLDGVENALLAFAQADMLERQRQYAKAQLKLKEGETLIQELLELERTQTAYEQRIIPAELHGVRYW
jgi:hypothetical protein